MTVLDEHVDALGRALRGPAGVRHDMLREVHDGLTDSAAAHVAGGLDETAAATRAVAEFGTVAELAGHYQAELTARQSRRTALYVAITFPAMVLGWAVLWRSGVTWGGPATPEVVRWIRLLSTLVDVTALTCGAAAAGLYGLTFLRVVPPRLLASVTGVVAGVGALATSSMSVTMNVMGGRVSVWTLASVSAYGVSFVVLVVSVRIAIRTVRTAAISPCLPSSSS